MKNVAYLRVSTNKQDLDQQRLAILDYAQKHKIVVVAVRLHAVEHTVERTGETFSVSPCASKTFSCGAQAAVLALTLTFRVPSAMKRTAERFSAFAGATSV